MPAWLLMLLTMVGGEIASRVAMHGAGKVGAKLIGTKLGGEAAKQAAKYGAKEIAATGLAAKVLPKTVGDFGRSAGSVAKGAMIAGPAYMGTQYGMEKLFAPAEPYGADSLAGPTRSTDDSDIQNLIRAVQSANGGEQMDDGDDIAQLLQSMPNVRMLYA